MSEIKSLNITIPEGMNKLELIEGIIKFVERRGCVTETNPHIKPVAEKEQNEEQKVRQILSVSPKE
jgi:hypothetical protein